MFLQGSRSAAISGIVAVVQTTAPDRVVVGTADRAAIVQYTICISRKFDHSPEASPVVVPVAALRLEALRHVAAQQPDHVVDVPVAR